MNVWTPDGYVKWGDATADEHELSADHWEAEARFWWSGQICTDVQLPRFEQQA